MRFLSCCINAFARFRTPVLVDLRNLGLVLVEGHNWDAGEAFDSNGAGKSLFFETIAPWVLFGKMPRFGDKRLGDEVCNEDGLADVSLDIETGSGARFTVRRTRGPGKNQLLLQGHKSDEEVGQFEVIKTEEQIAQLVGFDYQALRAALFLQGSGLSFASLGYSAQQAVLESILRFDILTEAQQLAKKDLAIADQQLLTVGAEISSVTTQIETSKQRLRELEVSKPDPIRIEATRQEIKTLMGQPSRKAELEKESTEVRQRVSEAQDQLRQLRQQLGGAQVQIGQMKEILKPPVKDEKRVCPTCGQVIKPSKKTVKDQPSHHSIEETLVLAQQQLIELTVAIEVHERVVLESGPRLHALEEQLYVERGHAGVLAQKVQTLKLLEEQAHQWAGLYGGEEGRRMDLQARLEVLYQDEKARKLQKQTVEFWAKGFGSDGLKAQLLALATPVLNDAAARYSEVLTDGSIALSFDLRREKRNQDIVKISSRSSAGSYDGLSSGEKRRVDLVVALSLRALARWRMASQLTFALFDEIFDPLDEAGVRRVVQLLQREMETLETVFVVSHNPYLKQHFPGSKTWVIEKAKEQIWINPVT